MSAGGTVRGAGMAEPDAAGMADAGAVGAAALLRPGLLQGVSLLLAGPTAPLGGAVAEVFAELGARVSSCLPDGEDEAAIDQAVAGVGDIDMLVVDGAGLFGDGAGTALRACLDGAWNVTRAVINQAFLPTEHSGRIVYLAPAPDAGEQAMAARAALENLARTLSVEWARHDINVVTIAPGCATSGAELAALVAYLASPAGTYFSGCLLDLDTLAR
ncbi:MAG TPA: SDR family NAD(P)-dependent oxidoreductase [Solirubrobacteraceae bacterium]|jgi:citronellol/citronellal dehydrogenase